MRKPSIEIYLTDEQKVTIKKAAAECRLSISEYCLKMIFDGKVHAPLSPTELKMMVDLTGIANNLNQAMKKVHQDPTSRIKLKELEAIIEKIGTLIL